MSDDDELLASAFRRILTDAGRTNYLRVAAPGEAPHVVIDGIFDLTELELEAVLRTATADPPYRPGIVFLDDPDPTEQEPRP
jgi:hypothetical protein